MDIADLRRFVAVSLGKDPATIGENPEFDSLDQLELITHMHDQFGSKANDVDDLENFNDLESLAEVLQRSGLID